MKGGERGEDRRDGQKEQREERMNSSIEERLSLPLVGY